MENASVPLKPLLLIAALVLAAHWVFLGWVQSSASPESNASQITRPFITRTLPPPESAATAVRSRTKPAAVRSPMPAKPRAISSAPRAAIQAPNTTQDLDKSAQEATDTQADETSATPSPDPVTEGVPTSADAPTVTASEPAPALASSPANTAAAPSAPISLPGSLRLKYDIKGEVSGLGYSASGELLWLHDGQTYDARLSVTHFLLGTRSQNSTGQITPEGLAPKRFGDKVRSEVAAHFERDKGEKGGHGKVIFSANTPSVDLQPGAQDQLSIFMQIASLLAGDPARYPVGSAFEMQAVGGRDADTWRFVIESEETLTLPGGEQRALRIKRPARQQNDITVELWLAPALGYLPARIRLTQTNGNFVDQQLAAFAPP